MGWRELLGLAPARKEPEPVDARFFIPLMSVYGKLSALAQEGTIAEKKHFPGNVEIFPQSYVEDVRKAFADWNDVRAGGDPERVAVLKTGDADLIENDTELLLTRLILMPELLMLDVKNKMDALREKLRPTDESCFTITRLYAEADTALRDARGILEKGGVIPAVNNKEI